MSEGEQKVPGFQVIVGLMRSGTSLLGHLLGEVGWARYAGESHVIFDGEEGVREAWSIIEPELPPELQGSEGPPFCDKVLVPGQVPDGGRFLARRAERVYLLLRHPLAVWRSLRDLGWEWGNWGYIIGQLEAMRRVVEWCPEGKLVAVGYSDLTTRTGRLSLFGRDVSSYRLLPKTGVPNWGDPEGLIRTGTIREMGLAADYERAVLEVGETIGEDGFQKAMEIYQDLVMLVGRMDLLEVERKGAEEAAKYVGLKKWGWYLRLDEWKRLFFTEAPVRVLEIGAFDGVSANMMLDHLFPHPESRVYCIDPFLPDPTTPEVCGQTREDFYENRRRGGHENQIEIFEGLSVEVLGWMISEEGYWNSFDFVYVDGSHRARDVLTDGVMSWNLLKYGGVMAFDDDEWKRGDDKFGWPRRGIDAFESVFRPELRLVKGGYRRIWQKVGSLGGE
jgi:predicted O-methyltransferase YrrM